mgnify:CR=1 FL=1|tara:strand:- start:2313 stop:3242 length:930 start_codon:yes stop_codon:yes gene_type:complete
MNELANIRTDSYENLARAMGIATDRKIPKKTSNLNRLRIWHSPVMGQVEVNGKLSNVEIIEGGSYRLELVHEDGSEFIYAKTMTLRPFMQRFMLRRYVANMGAKEGQPKGSFHRTIMADSLNMDLKDNTGKFNCGKPSGYVEDFKALSPDMQDLIRQIKRVRVIFGTVSLEDAVDQNGQPVGDKVTAAYPFIWEIDNKDAFKTLGDRFAEYSAKSKLPLQYVLHFDNTIENPLPNGSKFYTPTAKVDFSEEFEITEEDEKLFHDFNDFIKNFNDYICKQWEEKVQTEQKNPSAADVETVEDFIDIDVDK